MKVIYTKLEVYAKYDDEQPEQYTFYGDKSEQKAIDRAKEIHARYPGKRIYIGVYSLSGIARERLPAGGWRLLVSYSETSTRKPG